MRLRNLIGVVLLYAVLNDVSVRAQRTSLDPLLGDFVRNLRSLFLDVTGRSGDDQNNVKLYQNRGVCMKKRLIATI